MAVVSFASGKGGVGKTTACLLAGTTLCEGGSVTIIDADQNSPLLWWNEGRQASDCPTMSIKDGNIGIGALLEMIEQERKAANLVLVDLEGVATSENARAFGVSDLVVLPMKQTELDLRSAVDVMREIKGQEAETSRRIPFSILFSQTKVVASRGAREIERNLRDASEIHTFATKIFEREPFNAMFNFRRPLEGLPKTEVLNVDKAVTNARAYAGELLARLHNVSQKEAA